MIIKAEFPVDDSIDGGKIFFSVNLSSETSVKFQVRSGRSQDELEKNAFVGPDGSVAGSGRFSHL